MHPLGFSYAKLTLFTKIKKNMKKRLMDASQKFFLSKRGLVETVIDQLKNIG